MEPIYYSPQIVLVGEIKFSDYVGIFGVPVDTSTRTRMTMSNRRKKLGYESGITKWKEQ